ncbi:hypothetical protein HCN44_003284 [Aphidius gifuensis]|uniref:F-box domain-containing protein n=1 Tax=Aphidius gifuensis TaxID=684658 RepID=A0A834XIM2_APHGI|nr:hypothetical protein HCN44_003284 [Aphidius gifuensis]
MGPEIPYKRKRIELWANHNDVDKHQRRNESSADRLTYDVLANIFTFLPLSERLKMDQVCHRWQVANTCEWGKTKKIHLTKWINQIKRLLTSTNVEAKLRHNSNFLTHLTITDYLCDSSVVNYINNNCLNIIYLNFKLYLNKINKNYLRKGFDNLNKLKSIKIKAVINDSSLSNTIDYYHYFLQTINSEINELYLQSNSYKKTMILLSEDFAWIIDGFSKLSHLTLRHFELDENAMVGICQSINLIHLDLHGCHIHDQMPILNLTNLEHLTLSWIANIDENLIDELPRLNKLQYLDINCSSLGNGMYDSISYIKTLVHLDVNHCLNIDDEFITNIIDNCKQLKHLDIACCALISSEVLERLGELNNLEYLNLDKVNNVNKNVIVSLTDDATKLKHLDISYAENLTHHDIEIIGKLRDLESLRMNRVNSVNNILIASIVFNCLKLKHLDLSNSTNLSERAYSDIAKLKNLERLVIVHSLDAQNAIPTEMPQLKYFNCSKSHKVYDEHVEKFLINCPNLEELVICQNPITLKIFNIAAKLTNQRKNNIPLTIYTSANFLPFIKETNLQLNLLKLSTEHAFKEHPFSYELED